MLLAIGTKTVITQGIALSVGINGRKYSNSMLQKKYCILKRGPYKGVEILYIINDVYINEHNDVFFLISRTRMSLGKLVLMKKFVLHLILGICIDQVLVLMLTFQNWLQRVFIGNYI